MYCYRCNTLAIADCQEFVTKGEAWKKGGTMPLNDLKVSELKVELHAHGVDTSNKSKEELEKAFNTLRAGINHVPALLQGLPMVPLSNLHLEMYEIAPVEPLHDIKRHLHNLIEELQKEW